MISAPIDQLGAGNRALVSYDAGILSKKIELLCTHLFGSILLQRPASHERIREPRDNQTLHPPMFNLIKTRGVSGLCSLT